MRIIASKRSCLSWQSLVLILVFGHLFFASPAAAQNDGGFCPPGSTPVFGGGGTMCQCPDGSDAGFRGCSGASQPPQQQGNYCPSGGICAFGTTCCGNLCCNQGSKCSPSGSCIPQEANDCGDGHLCNAGTQCWRAPTNIGSIRQGELKCVTSSQAADLERALMEQLQAEQRRKQAEEDARRQQEQEVRRQQIDKQIAQVKQRQQQFAKSHTQASEQMQALLDRQRQLNLQKITKLNQEQILRRAPMAQSCDARKIQAIADGLDPDKISCGSVGSTATQSVPSQPSPSTQQTAWAKQLDYLKDHAVRLQPESRMINSPSSSAAIESSTAAANGSSSYVLKPRNDGMVDVVQNGKVASTISAQSAQSQFGYRSPAQWATLQPPGPANSESKPDTIYRNFQSSVTGFGKTNTPPSEPTNRPSANVSASAGIEFQGGKVSSSGPVLGISKSVESSAFQAPGQAAGFSSQIDVAKLRGDVTTTVGSKSVSVNLSTGVTAIGDSISYRNLTMTNKILSADAHVSGAIGVTGASLSAGAGATLVSDQIDANFKVGRLTVDVSGEGGVGVSAHGDAALGAKGATLSAELGFGPQVGLGLSVTAN